VRFLWDPAKAALNCAKHGVSFGDALTAFDDPRGLYVPDRGHPERGNLIGLSATTHLLFVVHVEMLTEAPPATRIISARRATGPERNRYQAQFEPPARKGQRRRSRRPSTESTETRQLKTPGSQGPMRKTDIRNPFYEDIRKNGIVVDVQREDGSDPPSSNPYYERIAAAGGLHAPGRPRRGEVRELTAVRSIRLPVELWKLVEAQAKREQISLNAAMRQAARIWLMS